MRAVTEEEITRVTNLLGNVKKSSQKVRDRKSALVEATRSRDGMIVEALDAGATFPQVAASAILSQQQIKKVAAAVRSTMDREET